MASEFTVLIYVFFLQQNSTLFFFSTHYHSVTRISDLRSYKINANWILVLFFYSTTSGERFLWYPAENLCYLSAWPHLHCVKYFFFLIQIIFWVRIWFTVILQSEKCFARTVHTRKKVTCDNLNIQRLRIGFKILIWLIVSLLVFDRFSFSYEMIDFSSVADHSLKWSSCHQ